MIEKTITKQFTPRMNSKSLRITKINGTCKTRSLYFSAVIFAAAISIFIILLRRYTTVYNIHFISLYSSDLTARCGNFILNYIVII